MELGLLQIVLRSTYTRFTPIQVKQLLHNQYYRFCWHWVGLCDITTAVVIILVNIHNLYITFLSKEFYSPDSLPPSQTVSRSGNAQWRGFSTAAPSRFSVPCLSPTVIVHLLETIMDQSLVNQVTNYY